MKRFYLFAVAVLLFFGCEELNNIVENTAPCDFQVGETLTNEAVSNGLQCALLKGVDTATTKLSALNGYFLDEVVKLYLPDEAETLINGLKNQKVLGSNLGEQAYNLLLKDIYEDLILSLNRAAEDAASSAIDIFINSIMDISFDDAMNILNGPDTAATHYLRVNTYSDLKGSFSPIIDESLNKDLIGDLSTNEIWGNFVSSYNSITDNIAFQLLNVPVLPDESLGEYATGKALTGLFIKVADEEYLIRQDATHRVNDILEKVFGD
ncbi:MAG: DUF4197 domain-containing protein [Ignavibacteria bacterium]|nr:DUF4197 domain-containing protein [Ignavibacteria bacterium]